MKEALVYHAQRESQLSNPHVGEKERPFAVNHPLRDSRLELRHVVATEPPLGESRPSLPGEARDTTRTCDRAPMVSCIC